MQRIQIRIAVGSPVSLIGDIKAQIKKAVKTAGESITSITDESIRRIEVIRGIDDKIELIIHINDPVVEIA